MSFLFVLSLHDNDRGQGLWVPAEAETTLISSFFHKTVE